MFAIPLTLFKIPLLITGASLTRLSVTSPTPPPKLDEQLKFGRKRDFLSSGTVQQLYPRSYVAVAAFLALYESAIIVALQYPAFVPSRLLTALLLPGDLPKVQLTSGYLLGWSLLVSGALLRIACYREMGRFFTFQVALREDHKLVTTGPYSVVRHPSYTGMIPFSIGALICSYGKGSWLAESGVLESLSGKVFALVWFVMVVYVPIALVRRVGKEDEILRKAFQKEWEEWAKRTPYRLVPGIY